MSTSGHSGTRFGPFLREESTGRSVEPGPSMVGRYLRTRFRPLGGENILANWRCGRERLLVQNGFFADFRRKDS
jgi:hypothetical protein